MRRKKKRLITHADSGIASLPPAPSAPAQASDDGSAVVTSDWVSFGGLPEKVEHKPLPVRRQTEPIIAYRGWELCDDNGPALRSVTADVVWDGPILRSGARPMERMNGWLAMVMPTRDPALGIFAYKDAWNSGTYGSVWGEVELFGTVIRHDFGYRAEIARIRRLVVPRSTQFYGTPAAGYVQYVVYPNRGIVTDDTLAQLAKRYQCDVRWWNGPFD